MLLRLALVLFSVAALTGGAAGRFGSEPWMPTCKEYTLPICTRDYNPVCGSDGKTYANECMLCLSNWVQKSSNSIVHIGSC